MTYERKVVMAAFVKVAKTCITPDISFNIELTSPIKLKPQIKLKPTMKSGTCLNSGPTSLRQLSPL